MKYKIIALMGKAGSGKDTILQKVLEEFPDKFNEIISCTSRPPREGEVPNKSYYFMTDKEFLDQVNEGTMLEWTNFNNWYYGTSKWVLDGNRVNIGVFNPAGVKQLLNNPNVDVTVYYVRAPAKMRLLRQLNREENPDIEEIIRRFAADEADFSNIQTIPYSWIINETPEDLASYVRYIGTKQFN